MEINLILDLIVVIAIFIGLYTGMKKGFVYSAISLVSYIATFLIAKFGSVYLSKFLYEHVVKGFIESNIATYINDILAKNNLNAESLQLLDVNTLLNQIQQSLPTFLQNSFNVSTVDPSVITFTSVADLSASITAIVFFPIILMMLRNILYVVLFILSWILFKTILKVTKIVKRIPVIKTANKLLGGILGVATSGLIVAFFAKLLSILMAFNGTNSFLGITDLMVKSTFIFKLFFNL